jgi:PadR family transcriptional regulator, regulatory protein PadR
MAQRALTVDNRLRIVDRQGSQMGKPLDLVQGTLDFLILKAIELEPRHGWAIAKRIQQISGDVLKVPQGSLYPALYRLERQGWIASRVGRTESGRDVKFYSLTRSGRAHLKKELKTWDRLSGAINLAIRAT